jgi:hypothetical protein
MKNSTMQLLATAAKAMEPHIHKITTLPDEAHASILLNDSLGITLTEAELVGLFSTENKLLFLLRAIGVRINIPVKDIDWWYYNKFNTNLPACIK